MRFSQAVLLFSALLAVGGIIVAYRNLARGGRSATVRAIVLAVVVPIVGAGGLMAVGAVKWLVAIHTIYLVLTLTLPVICAAALWLTRADTTRRRRVVLTVGVLPAVVGLYATHVEATWLRVDRITIEADVDRPIRIGVIADIQNARVGAYEREVVDRMIAAEPDFVLIAGDIWQVPDAELTPELRAPFDELIGELVDAVGRVFVVEGDHDRYWDLDEMAQVNGATLLLDGMETINVRGQQIAISGLAVGSGGPWRREAIEAIAAVEEASPDVFTILLAHHPDVFMSFEDDEHVDLFVGGHTHGGQVVIPFYGPLLKFTEVSRDVARGGLHTIDGRLLYVSSGVGVERDEAPQVRFLSRPSIGIIDLVPAEDTSESDEPEAPDQSDS